MFRALQHYQNQSKLARENRYKSNKGESEWGESICYEKVFKHNCLTIDTTMISLHSHMLAISW